MGIMERFKDIMSANINALLDKAEDPEKMIDQYLRNMESDLGKVKAETASVIAEESRAKRALDECNANIAKMQTYAEKAINAGNDNDARQFLAQKKVYTDQLTSLQNTYQIASENAAKMRNMHDKLVNDISQLNARRDSIKAKMAAAKTQQRINKIGSSALGVANDMSAFERMEAKADKMLDEANAMSELNKTAGEASIDDLASKYDNPQTDSSIDDELAALKAQMGK
ncbi:MAG: PspA/IM30 family protein [Lachnospiraceae bacterium]|nr:PspA/IM30 family protein [Lachnospiraceae bacterium]